MNKKAFLATGIVDIYAYLIFGLLLLMFFIIYVFLAKSPPEIRETITIENSEVEHSLMAYLETPFSFELLGRREIITIRDFFSKTFTKTDEQIWREQTNTFFSNFFENTDKGRKWTRGWAVLIRGPDKKIKYGVGTRLSQCEGEKIPSMYQTFCKLNSAITFLHTDGLTLELRYYKT